ncbi:hypothetical protein [Sphingobacterium sp. JUb56]|uniref:hypothetical protein n=1 Tax=Sphingobacterium sp. JUb56 TaxID=2587145 RepID=UPI00161B0000|nr:hypothetical protein [Sphingobacterium sp. JUb56]MBB2949330.1 hypothetical protein [Sphingobacterium sp. JUb56]
MKLYIFLKSNVVAIAAVIAIASLLTLKVSGDIQQKKMTIAFSFDGKHTIPAQESYENRWNVTPNDLPINGLIKKPICYWLKIRI